MTDKIQNFSFAIIHPNAVSLHYEVVCFKHISSVLQIFQTAYRSAVTSAFSLYQTLGLKVSVEEASGNGVA